MKAGKHVVVSAASSLGLQATVHSWPATLACFFSGFLIDLDHHFEFFLFNKRFPFRFKDLEKFCFYSDDKKVYLFLHGYEYLFALWIAIYMFHMNLVWMGLALGMTLHIVCDQFTNPIKPLFYFLTFRIKMRFEKSRLMSESYFQRALAGKEEA